MGLKSCFICCKECMSNPVGLKEQATSADERKSVNSHLQVIFLLRKLLEIPEDTCCKLLQRFGNPDLWIECCHSCSILVEQSQQIFDQMASLEKHYEQLRKNIKTTILKSQKEFDYEWKCEAIVRSHLITKDIDYFIDTVVTEADKGEPAFESADSHNQMESTCLVTSPNEEQYSYIDYQQPIVICQSNPWEQEAVTIEASVTSIQGAADTATVEGSFSASNFSGKTEPVEYDPDSVGEHYYNIQETNELQIHQDAQNIHVEQSTSFSAVTESEDMTGFKFQERQHTLKDPQKCQICGKRMSSLFALQRHMKSHTDEKFICEVCHKSFSTKPTLRRHLKIHTGEKPYKCDYCEKCFSRLDYLKPHLNTHINPIPFQ